MRLIAILFCATSSIAALIAASYFGALMSEGSDDYALVVIYLTLAAEAASLWSAFKIGSEWKRKGG